MVITKYYQGNTFCNRDILLLVLKARRAEIRVPTQLGSGEGCFLACRRLPGVQLASFSLHPPHMVENVSEHSGHRGHNTIVRGSGWDPGIQSGTQYSLFTYICLKFFQRIFVI